jgi:hypothetical protein
MLAYADRDLLSALRADFLHTAQEDVIRLRSALSSDSGGTIAATVEEWIGGAALLGFPEIGQKSLEIQGLLQRTRSSNALQPKITEVDRAVLRAQSRTLLGASEVPAHIASYLDGKKIALVGFAEAEACSLSAEYKRLGADAQAFANGPAAVAAESFREMELVVLCLRPNSDLSFWKKSRMARRKSFLVLESGGVQLPGVTELPGAAGDILWEPWDARTLLLRSLWLVASHAAQEAAAVRPTLAAKCRTAARWLTGRAFVLAAWGGFVGFAVYVFTRTPLAELLQGLAWLESVIRWYVAMLLGWMIYNVLLYRWKGPRVLTHAAVGNWTRDQLGRDVVLTRGTSLQDAHLVVDVQDGKKVYSAFFPRHAQTDQSSRPGRR